MSDKFPVFEGTAYTPPARNDQDLYDQCIALQATITELQTKGEELEATIKYLKSISIGSYLKQEIDK